MCFYQRGYWKEFLPAQKDKQDDLSPDLSTKNQIRRKFRRSLYGVYVKRGADVASDHHLLIAKLKLSLKRNWTGDSRQRPRHDTTMLLKDTTKQQEFKIVLLNKFQVLEEPLEGFACLLAA